GLSVVAAQQASCLAGWSSDGEGAAWPYRLQPKTSAGSTASQCPLRAIMVSYCSAAIIRMPVTDQRGLGAGADDGVIVSEGQAIRHRVPDLCRTGQTVGWISSLTGTSNEANDR